MSPTDLTGRLLIAMPSIGDQRFERSVILVCAHSDEYAMGLVINKPMEGLSLTDMFEQLDIPCSIQLPDREVLEGGPVGTDRGFVIHSEDVYCEDATLEVAEGVCLTATRDILHAMASDSGPNESLLALGYSGWGPGQLELELRENAWLVGTPDPALLFDTDHGTKWSRALDAIGIRSGHLQSMAGRA
mgnify:CR=1 FL=1